MNISRCTLDDGRCGWRLENDVLALTVLEGGGHFAVLTRHDLPDANPYWNPVWEGMEPWTYKPAQHDSQYELKLLAAIRGHNICLGWFGGEAESESRFGHGPHGEAPVARWKEIKKSIGARSLRFTYGCELPNTYMRLERTIALKKGEEAIEVSDKVENLLKREIPFTMAQHVTFGPPFLEKGVTTFDMSATRGHTFPGAFEAKPRLQENQAFSWPHAPGVKEEKVNLRQIAKRYRVSSDFSTQLMDPSRDDAWLAAVNPKQELLVVYHWERRDYPWVGNWEENNGRKGAPWAGKSLTRGMEFANTPFPISLRESVERGALFDTPTFDWLGARETRTFSYRIAALKVTSGCKGVMDVHLEQDGLHVAVLEEE